MGPPCISIHVAQNDQLLSIVTAAHLKAQTKRSGGAAQFRFYLSLPYTYSYM